ncbi:MAG: hypothetical protein NTX51_02135 [Verrucomicrobia bacterium]|nr:hypothetical protein [Verrucomicrobiota bacterium]
MATLREVTLDDYENVMAVLLRNGLSRRPQEDWARMISENPLRSEGRKAIPAGWVLAADSGQVVGHLGNIPVAYRLAGKSYTAMVASSWAVDPGFRNQSLFLLTQYFGQREADLFINTTATAEAGRVFAAFGAKQIPLAHYDRPLFWITHHAGFVASVLRSRGLGAVDFLKFPLGLATALVDGVRHWSGVRSGSGICQAIEAFDARFDGLGQAFGERSDRLLAFRNCQWLNWHFGDRLRREEVWGFTASKESRLEGYVLVQRRDSKLLGLRRAQIVDLQLRCDDERVVMELGAAVIQRCRQDRIHLLEASGFSVSKRRSLELLRPWQRRWPAFPACYKAKAPGLAAALEKQEAWDCCQFDGDASL